MRTFSTQHGYYYTKEGPDRWVVHGRRTHLRILRSYGPTGKVDRAGDDFMKTVFWVEPPLSGSIDINLDDQLESSADQHGSSTLGEAVRYAVGKLKEYDDSVDPQTRVNPTGVTMKARLYFERDRGQSVKYGSTYDLIVEDEEGFEVTGIRVYQDDETWPDWTVIDPKGPRGEIVRTFKQAKKLAIRFFRLRRWR